jgi:hypothetical protein
MRFAPLLPLALLALAACSQVAPAPIPTTDLQAAATQMPLPAFNSTFTNSNTRGFWFEAPVDFRITGLRVPDEAGHGLQNVEVFKLAGPPPEFPGSASGGQVFYKTGVPSGEIIETDLAFSQGDYVGIFGAAGDSSTMYNSYGSGDFSSSILGEPVVLKRFLTQTNLVSSGGNQPYSAEAGGSIARVEVYVESAKAPMDIYTLDFDTAPTNRLTFAVQVGNGMTYTGSGDPSPYGVQVLGKRIINKQVRAGNQARVLSQDGDNVLTVVSQGTSTPNPQGGVLEFKPHAKFGTPSAGGNNGLVTLKSITIHNVTTSGVVVLCGNGSCGKPMKLERAAEQTLTFDQAGVGTIRIRVNNAFSVDDVVLEVPASETPPNPCERDATSRC